MAGRKVFQAAEILYAADVNEYLMNQSVMVFANSTARSAALTAPTEGMVTYLEDTNKLEVYTGAAWVDVNDNAGAIPKSTVTTAGDLIVADGSASVTRLGIGSNGQVLSSNGTTATWTTPAGGGGYELISSTSLSSQSSVTFSSISQTFRDLRLVIRDATPSSDYSIFRLRFNGDTSNNYRNIIEMGQSANLTFNLSYLEVSGPTSSSVADGAGSIDIYDYANAAAWKLSRIISVYRNADNSSNARAYFGGGIWGAASAITSITLLPGASNFNAGTALLYGVK